MEHHSPTTITNIDRRHCQRIVPMKVMVMGLSRTGTDSIRKALLQLGYHDTYHGFEAATENPRDCEMWLEAFRAKYDHVGKPFGRKEFDQLLGHCQALCDGPATCFTPELLQAYPEAKIVLSNRDIDAWHHSVKSALLENIFTPKRFALSFLAWLTRSPNRWTHQMFIRVFTDMYDGDFETNGKRVFQEHYDLVRSLVPKERLLEYRVEDGWGPLCQFLGEKAPNRPFPNGNNKQELDQRIGHVINWEVRRIMAVVTRILVGFVGVSFIICLVQLLVGFSDLESQTRIFFQSDFSNLEF